LLTLVTLLVVVVERRLVGAERWKKAMDLVRFNNQSGMKELSVTLSQYGLLMA